MFRLTVSGQGTLGQDSTRWTQLQALGGNPGLTDTHRKDMEIGK